MKLTNEGKAPHGVQFVRYTGDHTAAEALEELESENEKTPDWLRAEGGIGGVGPGEAGDRDPQSRGGELPDLRRRGVRRKTGHHRDQGHRRRRRRPAEHAGRSRRRRNRRRQVRLGRLRPRSRQEPDHLRQRRRRGAAPDHRRAAQGQGSAAEPDQEGIRGRKRPTALLPGLRRRAEHRGPRRRQVADDRHRPEAGQVPALLPAHRSRRRQAPRPGGPARDRDGRSRRQRSWSRGDEARGRGRAGLRRRRAKAFYEALGFRMDIDHVAGDDFRVVQLTPPGSECSIIIGTGITHGGTGSIQGLQLVADRRRGGPRRARRPRRRGRGGVPRPGRDLLPPRRGVGGKPARTPNAATTARLPPSAIRTATAGCSKRSRRALRLPMSETDERGAHPSPPRSGGRARSYTRRTSSVECATRSGRRGTPSSSSMPSADAGNCGREARITLRAAVAQLARASACHAEGRGFESLQPLRGKPRSGGAFLCRSSATPIAGGFLLAVLAVQRLKRVARNPSPRPG